MSLCRTERVRVRGEKGDREEGEGGGGKAKTAKQNREKRLHNERPLLNVTPIYPLCSLLLTFIVLLGQLQVLHSKMYLNHRQSAGLGLFATKALRVLER